MQEPQYRSPGVRELLDKVAQVARALHVDHEHAAARLHAPGLPGLDADTLKPAYTDAQRVGQFRSRAA